MLILRENSSFGIKNGCKFGICAWMQKRMMYFDATPNSAENEMRFPGGMRRIKIKEIALESGVSRATVDRVLNNRAGVRPRTRVAVETAMRRLAAPDSTGGFRGRPFDAVLRLGGGMAQQCRDAMASYLSAGCRLYDMFQQDEGAILAHIDELAEAADRPLIVAVKDTSRMRSRLSKLRRAGKTVIAMVTDLASDSRDAFVGIDNRAAGQAAAFIVGRSLGDRPTSVGVVLGELRVQVPPGQGNRLQIRPSRPVSQSRAGSGGTRRRQPGPHVRGNSRNVEAASGDQRHLQCQRRQCGPCPRRQGSGPGGRHHDHFP